MLPKAMRPISMRQSPPRALRSLHGWRSVAPDARVICMRWRAWLEPELFRIGASSLLADIERQLEHYVSGRYSSFNRHPVA